MTNGTISGRIFAGLHLGDVNGIKPIACGQIEMEFSFLNWVQTDPFRGGGDEDYIMPFNFVCIDGLFIFENYQSIEIMGLLKKVLLYYKIDQDITQQSQCLSLS